MKDKREFDSIMPLYLHRGVQLFRFFVFWFASITIVFIFLGALYSDVVYVGCSFASCFVLALAEVYKNRIIIDHRDYFKRNNIVLRKGYYRNIPVVVWGGNNEFSGRRWWHIVLVVLYIKWDVYVLGVDMLPLWVENDKNDEKQD